MADISKDKGKWDSKWRVGDQKWAGVKVNTIIAHEE